MRTKIVTFVLAAMFIALGVMFATRTRTPHQSPPLPVQTPPPPTATASASAPVTASASASVPPPVSVAPPVSASAAPATPKKLLDRPLRVIALGWEVAAPTIFANAGVDPSAASDFTAAGLEVQVSSTQSLERIEAALARGGADKDGADVAIVPMCQFVAAYERLRALTPEAFFVTGFSRGREAILTAKDALPDPAKGEVKVVGTAGEPAAFLALFALDLAGIKPNAVRFVAAGATADEAPLAAVDRDLASSDSARQKIWLTTADASRLVTFVAIAPSGMIEKSDEALAAWAKVEMAGATKLAADPPAAARQIAKAQGAPDPLALLRRSGQTAAATLADNQKMFGVAGKSALTMETLFLRAWFLWRGAGVLATPAPEQAPVSKRVVELLAKDAPPLERPAEVKVANADSLKPLLIVRVADEKEVPQVLGITADAFDRSPLRAAIIRNGAIEPGATKKLIEGAGERFDVAGGRVIAAKKALGKSGGAIEILQAP